MCIPGAIFEYENSGREYEGMVYIGDIIDMDGNGWVDMETAEMLLAENG